MRIILDTNLWISYLISRNLIAIDELIESKAITLLFSQELMNEFLEVAQRPKLKNYFSDSDLEAILILFDDFGELIPIESNTQICRNAKDDFLLNLAIDGKADFLITGDKDLLELEKIESTSILTFKQFVDQLKR